VLGEGDPDGMAPPLQQNERQIAEHRHRASLVLRACWMLYVALGCFIGTSLALAATTLSDQRFGIVASLLAILGMICLLGAAIAMGREVSMAVKSLDAELETELAKRRRED
jgi:hypothetical protein